MAQSASLWMLRDWANENLTCGTGEASLPEDCHSISLLSQIVAISRCT